MNTGFAPFLAIEQTTINVSELHIGNTDLPYDTAVEQALPISDEYPTQKFTGLTLY
jgi:hypothetical protein